MPPPFAPDSVVEQNDHLTPSLIELKKVLDLAHAHLSATKAAGNADLHASHAKAYAKVGLWVGWLIGLAIPQRPQIAADALNMAGEVDVVLTLSTAHVEMGTSVWLSELAAGAGKSSAIAVYEKGEFGWGIHHLPAFGPIEDLPEDLQPLIRYCFERGIAWLCLDRDGPEDAQFPFYEW